MSRHILVIKGSPRKNGNTSAMADAFARGAQESGNTVTEFVLREKTQETVQAVEPVRAMAESVSRKMI